jgi:FkbM family methyltransferase
MSDPMPRPPLACRFARVLGHGPDFKGKDRLLRLLCDPDRMADTPFAAPFWDGQTYRGDLAVLMDWWVYVYGGYEIGLIESIRAIAAELPRPSAFVDIGLNAAHHSLAVCRRFDRVIGFEAHPEVFAAAERRLAENGFGNAELLNMAVADKAGTLTLHTFEEGAHNRGTSTLLGKRFAGGREIAVPAVALDDLEIRARLDPFAGLFLKIDVEGAEHLVLAGGERLIAGKRPVIYCETDGPAKLHPLVEAGYRIQPARSYYRRLRLLPSGTENAMDWLCLPEERAAALLAALRRQEFVSG